MAAAKKAKKEAKHKSLWQIYLKKRRNSTNTDVKEISDKQTNETNWPGGKDGENDEDR